MMMFTQVPMAPTQPGTKKIPVLWHKPKLSVLSAALLLLFSFSNAQAQCDLTLTPTNLRQPTCGANDGSFSVQVTGIDAPYQYVLYKEAGGNFVQQETGTLIAGSPTFVFLTGGTYKVSVSKGGTCSGEVTVNLPQQELTLTAANLKFPTCGGNDGSFTVQVTGIVAPYQYVLYKEAGGILVQQETGTLIAGSPTFIFLTGGTYKVVISKSGTCSGEVTVNLPQQELTLTAANLKFPTCGGNDGSFTVQVTGIVAPYQYVLYKEAGGSLVQQETGTLIAGSPTFIFLTGGTYKVAISKSGTCSGEVTVNLPQQELTMTAANLKQPTCGGNDGSFTVQVTGIVAPYQYVLYKEVGGSLVQQETGTLIAGSPTFIFLTGGTYKVAISKSGTCSGEVTVNLPQQELTMTAANLKQPTCGGNDGSFTVQVTGIVAPYQYVLYKEVGGSLVQQETGTLIAGSPTFIFLTDGTYKVAISKGGTCSGEVQVVLQESPLTISLESFSLPLCNENTGSFILKTGGITAPYQYTVSKEINGNFSQVASGTALNNLPAFEDLSGGVYKVTFTKGSCTGSFVVYLNCETLDSEGCSPGYWKSQTGSWSMTNYSPTQTVESVFDVPDVYGLGNMTLLQALQSKGGSNLKGAVQTLLRAATAAVLNAIHQDVDYTIRLQQIITDVNAALGTGDRNTILSLAATLDKYNNKYCPLTANKAAPVVRQSTQPDPQGLQMYFSVKAAPNPSANYFTVQIESGSLEKISVRVMDMQGHIIEQRSSVQSKQTIRIGDSYIPGVYLLEVQQGNERKQLKLLKMGK